MTPALRRSIAVDLRGRYGRAFLVWVGLIVGASASFAQRFSESTLPILVVDAAAEAIPDEPKVYTRLRIIDNGPGRVNRLTDPARAYDSFAGIERRGSSSQDLFPKVGYGIELRDRDNADIEAPLLGMPEEGDWVLHGPYADKTLIRNAFTYSLARSLGEYAPRTRMVELTLGGQYVGVYALVESVKRDKYRVDVAKLGADENTGDDLTGGYIIKADKFTGEDGADEPSFTLPPRNRGNQKETRLLYHYPKPRDITPQQRAYIKNWMSDFEARLASDDFEDDTRGYAPLIDERSFVDLLIVNEITKNVDGYRLSTYAYKDKDSKGGRLHMGPVWDFNLAIGNANYCEGDRTEGWVHAFETYCPEDGFQGPFWYARLWQSYEFRAAAAARWQSLRRGGEALSDERLYGLYDSLATVASGAPARRNFERWPVLGQYTWPNVYVPTSHADALAFAKTFLRERVAWLDGQFALISGVAEGDAIAETVSVYPNPGTGDGLRIVGLAPAAYPATVNWYDATGRIVLRERISEGATVDGPRQAGVYAYRIEGADGGLSSGRWVSGVR